MICLHHSFLTALYLIYSALATLSSCPWSMYLGSFAHAIHLPAVSFSQTFTQVASSFPSTHYSKIIFSTSPFLYTLFKKFKCSPLLHFTSPFLFLALNILYILLIYLAYCWAHLLEYKLCKDKDFGLFCSLLQ